MVACRHIRPRRAGIGWFRLGLSTKLLVLTIIFIMLAEVVVLVPLISNHRVNWLRDRLATADVVSIALSEMNDVPRGVQDKLLAATGALTIAVREGRMRRLVAMTSMPPEVGKHIDLGEMSSLQLIWDAFDTLINGANRYIHVLGTPDDRGFTIELVVPENGLRASMISFAGRIMGLSAIISVISAALVFFSLRRLFLRRCSACGWRWSASASDRKIRPPSSFPQDAAMRSAKRSGIWRKSSASCSKPCRKRAISPTSASRFQRSITTCAIFLHPRS